MHPIFQSLLQRTTVLLTLLLFGGFIQAQTPRILVFSKTAGFRHTSIEPGKIALIKMGQSQGFAVDTTENAAKFTEANLKQYAAVIFLCTTGNVFDALQQNAFERYIQSGGGYVGIHSATDTEYDWPWYGKLAGGYFTSHPSTPSNVQKGIFHIEDKTHPSTSFLPDPWERTDEFYDFRDINPNAKILVSIDEKSYFGAKMGVPKHPMSWYHDYDGGRAFYTAMGHTNESFSEDLFLRHLGEGLKYAMGNKPLDYSKAKSKVMPEENRFTKVVLEEKLEEPVELTMLDNNRVLFIQRRGAVKLFDPKVGKSKTIATIPVSTKYLPDAKGNQAEAEDGLLGLAKDPNFAQNNWIYLYYSPPGTEAKNILTRYELRGEELVLDSKKVLLEIPVQRDQCCHTGGSIAFDAKGNLYLSTGDNTNPHGSDGMNPIDERAGRGPWDAQKSSGNTNDLRGKIIRIKPQPDGTYTIPEGNLFPPGTAKTRPEIYTMGHRNPYRISIDQKTGFVYWGDVGPDGNKPMEGRGPEGFDEVGQARKAGNFGWPYFIGDNKAYTYYDFEAKKSGAMYDVNAPINKSPNNTGLNILPPAQKAFVWYPYAESKDFPLVGTGGRNAMAGPVYYASDFKNAKRAFPDYYDGKFLQYEWMRGWIMAVTMDKEGNFVSMERFMPSHKFSNPIDMEFNADGDLYMLEYGTGWFQGNDDARLIRIEYNGGNRKPVIEVAADKPSGAKPLTVQLSSAGTKDYDSDPLSYEWKVALKAGGGTPLMFKEPNPKLTLKTAGVYTATLTVKDGKGESATRSVELIVGNEPPKLDFTLTKGNKTFFFPNKDIAYKVAVTDKEDGSIANGKIDPSEVAVSIDYLPEGYDKIAIAQGHRSADQNSRFARAIKLIDGTDCKACHKAAEKSIGPSFRDIALRYRGQADAAALLAGRVINGSSGIWGQTAMAAHPALSKDDSEVIVRYILRHEDASAVEMSLPAEGTFTTTVPSRGDKGVGVYLLRAAYKDRGVKGLPSLSSEQTYVLRNPNVDMSEIDYLVDFNKMKFGANHMAIAGGNDSHIGFKQVDLTGVAEIGLRVSAPAQMNAAGGIIEIRLDSPTGTLIGSTSRIETSAPSAGFTPPPPALVAIKPTTGVHDIYYVAKNDKAEAGRGLFVISGLMYNAEVTPSTGGAKTNTPPPPAAGNKLDQYAGKYKMTGLPFETIEVSVKEGKLIVAAGDQAGEVTPLAEPDKFDAAGQAVLHFVRDAQGKVTQIKLIASGFSFDGEKM
ncbi:MAG TPA: ThuA domain-containing protein [Haliscomenobacter sp.]|uniref:ThuA domain-containing protein n=1 Tax=Haliscomenobacter sp. TaxID=2717303 RepID=UPI002D079C26|nr:ThuA domain-containing protein [Haliscomenobacter sp.]HOY19975.1 ThuA domain-containing protein [Haliscomenobacter sp.]